MNNQVPATLSITTIARPWPWSLNVGEQVGASTQTVGSRLAGGTCRALGNESPFQTLTGQVYNRGTQNALASMTITWHVV